MSEELIKPLPGSRVRRLTAAAKTFQGALSDEAQAYLDGRGILEAGVGLGLGLVPEDCDLEWEPYRGMLAIPYRVASGDVVFFKFRSIRGEKVYRNTAGAAVPPYNVGAVLRATDSIVIAEGELEVVTLQYLGIPAVGIAGVNLWKPHFARLFDGIPNVIAWGDPDEAGREFNNTVQKAIPRATAAFMKKDINDTLVQDDPTIIFEAFTKAGGKV